MPSPPAHTPTSVLIVDDLAENITAMAGMLRHDYRVLFATSGADALQLLQDQAVDLILLDVLMPDMDGYEVCRRLKHNLLWRDIPVIFVSALGEAGNEARGLSVGAADYLHKPCHPDIIRLRVQMHLERRQQERTLQRLVQQRTAELDDTRTEIVRRLGRAAEYRDNETGLHVIRVGNVASLLARAVGAQEPVVDILRQAAPLHDVGKIGIPDHILLKPGPLTASEWETMKTHTFIGAEIIGQHESALMQMARTICLSHHEKWNGQGYPGGLRGDAIPLEGRITAIADVFDALVSERSYKKAWPCAQAIAYIRQQSGIAFDPVLVEHFMRLVPEIETANRAYADTLKACDPGADSV